MAPTVGADVWAPHADLGLLPGVVESVSGDSAVVRFQDVPPRMAPRTTVPQAALAPLLAEDVKGDPVADMTALQHLSDATVLHNIRRRFQAGNIYTNTGSILVAVNPYRDLALYGDALREQYATQAVRELPPHVFSVAKTALQGALGHRRSQAILVSGESGAGKTETTKHLLQFLVSTQHGRGHPQPGNDGDGGDNDDDDDDAGVDRQILLSSLVLESFGNAKTVRNNNSSRFGKYVQIHFDVVGRIVGATIRTFLLEKSRLVQLSEGERNYHIFYQLCAGASEQDKREFMIGPASSYQYLNSSSLTIDGVDDAAAFARLKDALDSLGILGPMQRGIFRILSGILWLGNVTFVGDPLRVADTEVVDRVAKLFDCSSKSIQEALCSRVLNFAGSEIRSPLSKEQAEEARNALAKQTYSRLFDWIVNFINDTTREGGRSIKMQESNVSIGILDIFGFEVFKRNSFEQLCINYTNEKLQEQFTRRLLKEDQDEYEREGIQWARVEYFDNAEVVRLIEQKPTGILSMLDEEGRLPKGSDETWMNRMRTQLASHARLSFDMRKKDEFTVHHYAAPVSYTIDGFLDKNKDALHADLIKIMAKSDHQLLRSLFPALPKSTSTSKKPSLCAQFRTDLGQLMETLSMAQTSYIRCIKPNAKQSSDVFDGHLVLDQLKASGVMELVEIRKLGMPFRLHQRQFTNRYLCLLADADKAAAQGSAETQAACRAVLAKLGVDSAAWKLGKSKLFMADDMYNSLEERRQACVVVAATRIQKEVRRWVCQTQYRLVLARHRARQAKAQRAETVRMAAEERYQRRVFSELARMQAELEKRKREQEAKEKREEEARQRELERQKKLEEEKKAAAAAAAAVAAEGSKRAAASAPAPTISPDGSKRAAASTPAPTISPDGSKRTSFAVSVSSESPAPSVSVDDASASDTSEVSSIRDQQIEATAVALALKRDLDRKRAAGYSSSMADSGSEAGSLPGSHPSSRAGSGRVPGPVVPRLALQMTSSSRGTSTAGTSIGGSSNNSPRSATGSPRKNLLRKPSFAKLRRRSDLEDHRPPPIEEDDERAVLSDGDVGPNESGRSHRDGSKKSNSGKEKKRRFTSRFKRSKERPADDDYDFRNRARSIEDEDAERDDHRSRLRETLGFPGSPGPRRKMTHSGESSPNLFGSRSPRFASPTPSLRQTKPREARELISNRYVGFSESSLTAGSPDQSPRGDVRPFRRNLDKGISSFRPPAKGAASNTAMLTPDEVAEWCLSLQACLDSRLGAEYFRLFLAREYATENLLFYLAVEEYQGLWERSKGSNSKLSKLAKAICDKHLTPGTELEVNISGEVRKYISKQMSRLPATLFAAAQQEVYEMMRRGIYPRFVSSDIVESARKQAALMTQTKKASKFFGESRAQMESAIEGDDASGRST